MSRHAELPPDVVLSVQGVAKRPPKPPPNPPRWLARYLPGVSWSAVADREDDGIDDEDEEDDAEDEPVSISRISAFREMSFDLRAGSALGLVGPDVGARRALLWMISGYVPPATGRILVRGLVGPLFGHGEMNITRQMGKRGVKLVATFFGWPWDLIQARWEEILEFARVEEIAAYFPEDSVEYQGDLTKRLLLSTALHMDATVYLVGGNFYASQPDFIKRTYALLEQRMEEGCGVIHSIGDAEHLASFCHEAIYIDNGRALFRGRLGEVARYAHERPLAVAPGAAKLPVRAFLGEEGPLLIGAEGGALEFEVDIVKPIELALGIDLVDGVGRKVRILSPERFEARRPGTYGLSVTVPGGGVVPRAVYRGALVGAKDEETLDDPEEVATLLSFEVEVTDGPDPTSTIERVIDDVRWGMRETTEA